MEIVLFFTPAALQIDWLSPKGQSLTREVRGAHVCIIAAGLPHGCRLDAETEMLVLYVERSFLRRFLGRKISEVLVSETPLDDLVVWFLASALRHLCREYRTPDASLIDRIGGGLAERLITRLDETHGATPVTGPCLTDAQLARVLQFMQANLKHDIHVVDFAKQTGHTPGHFSELFKNKTRRSPYHYLKEIRMLKAHTMILTGDYRLREVALAVGYSNADHFGEVFHKFWKYSAKELLTRMRRADAKRPG